MNTEHEKCKYEFEKRFPLVPMEYYDDEKNSYRFIGPTMGDIPSHKRNNQWGVWQTAWATAKGLL